MAVPFQDGLSQFFDDSGNPLSGGLVYTYRAGTTTPVATYTTRAGTVEHDNPVTLDAAGRVSIWLDRSTAYRFDVKKADGTLIDSVDNIILSDGAGPAYQIETFTATEGQTVINLAGTYTQGINAIAVYVGDGGSLYLASGTDYTETTESSITLSSPLAAGELVTVILGNRVSFSAGAVADASEVSYTPTGGSATNVKAWLDSKLKDYQLITPQHFGAVADGVTNDAAAITSALTAAALLSAEVFFPPGTYLCTSQIVVHRQKVRGDGATLKFSGLSGTTDCVILQGSTSETPLIWDGIDIDANNTGRDAMVLSGGKVGSTQADYLRVFSCRINQAVRDGIHIEPVAERCWLEDFRFQDVRVSDPGRHGVAIVVPDLIILFVNQGKFDNCEIRGAGRTTAGYDIYCDVLETTGYSSISEMTFISCQIDASDAAFHQQASIQLNNSGGAVNGGKYNGWTFLGCTVEDTGTVITGTPIAIDINGSAQCSGLVWLGGILTDYGNLVDLSTVSSCFIKDGTLTRNQSFLEATEKIQWDATGVATLEYGGQTGQVKTAGVFLADDGFREGRNIMTNTAGAIVAQKGFNKLNLTANVTSITFPTGTSDELDGQIISFLFVQDATGGRTVSGWPASVFFSGGSLTVTAGAFKSTHVRFQYEKGQTSWFEISRSLDVY